MTLHEYLKRKYGTSPVSISGIEARVFNIPYPLASRWLREHGSKKLTREMAARILASFEASPSENKYQAAAVVILKKVTQAEGTETVLEDAGHSYQSKRFFLDVITPLGAAVGISGDLLKEKLMRFAYAQMLNEADRRAHFERFCNAERMADTIYSGPEIRHVAQTTIDLLGL